MFELTFIDQFSGFGNSVASVLAWLKIEGEIVDCGDELAIISITINDKDRTIVALSHAPSCGILIKHCFNVGEKIISKDSRMYCIGLLSMSDLDVLNVNKKTNYSRIYRSRNSGIFMWEKDQYGKYGTIIDSKGMRHNARGSNDKFLEYLKNDGDVVNFGDDLFSYVPNKFKHVHKNSLKNTERKTDEQRKSEKLDKENKILKKENKDIEERLSYAKVAFENSLLLAQQERDKAVFEAEQAKKEPFKLQRAEEERKKAELLAKVEREKAEILANTERKKAEITAEIEKNKIEADLEKSRIENQTMVEVAELNKQNTLESYPLDHHIDTFLKRIEEVDVHDVAGDRQNKFFKLYHSLKEALESANKISTERLELITDEAVRMNQVEALLDMYSAKISRVKNDVSLDEGEKAMKIEYWKRLRDRDVTNLGGG